MVHDGSPHVPKAKIARSFRVFAGWSRLRHAGFFAACCTCRGRRRNGSCCLTFQGVEEHYNFRFGADHPFLPSNATTDTGQFIDSKAFLSAKYCGHCHQEAYAQWRQTAHANSFYAPWAP